MADQQALYSYVGDVNAVFISEQDENTGKNGGFTFVMDDDGDANPDFEVIDKNDENSLFKVTAEGNVGIGTTSPNAKLEVNAGALGENSGRRTRHCQI